MALAFHNTLSGVIAPFEPRRAGEVGLYVCGPTVYDRSHVGHARSIVFFDTVVRYLRFAGYRVTFVRNITDIEDKIIKRANEEGISTEALTARFIALFTRDVAALGCVQPDVEPRATGHIAEMIELVRVLEERGLAYRSAGDVYFAVGKLPDYGKLSKRRLDDLMAGARVEVGERKREPLDFVLWKGAKPGEPFWESPFGPGRPGWHLECSAMSTKYLGQPFDIHGGGEDLVFPHHENEIAQSEGATGTPFVRYWLHHAFVRINSEKMSKSLGNFLTIEEVLERMPVEAFRLFLVSTHYRSPIDFTDQGLLDAQRASMRVHETAARLEQALGDAGVATPTDAAAALPYRSEFVAAMDDDLNTARAVGVLFEEIREVNRLLDAADAGTAAHRDALAAHHRNLVELAGVLGVLRQPASAYLASEKHRYLASTGVDPAEIERLIGERTAARKARDFKRADEIRNELLARGVALKDGADGTSWSTIQS